jgi:protoheme IX farnesyltransferase
MIKITSSHCKGLHIRDKHSVNSEKLAKTYNIFKGHNENHFKYLNTVGWNFSSNKDPELTLYQKQKRILFAKYIETKRIASALKPHVARPLTKIRHFTTDDAKARLQSHVSALTSYQRSETTWRDIKQLTKIDLCFANTAVTASAYLLGGGTFLSWGFLSITAASHSLAMATQVYNQIIEVKYDKEMKRTQNRPLPSGRMSLALAQAIGDGLFLFSNAILLAAFPYPAFWAGWLISVSYLTFYTQLKRVSIINTSVGAVVGGLPAYLGWTATGSSVFAPIASLALAPEPFFMFLFMFAWQYPHFYSILWLNAKDYERAGYVMQKDHKKMAENSSRAVAAMFIATASLPYCSSSLIHPAFLLSALPLYPLYSAIRSFHTNPTIENAKSIKKWAYLAYTVFFIGFFGKPLWDRIARYFDQEETSDVRALQLDTTSC